MSNIHVVFSNRMEQLLAQLGDRLADTLPQGGLFAKQHLLLDNQVLGQWLNMRLAEQHGIAANIAYVQPSSLFWQLAQALLGSQLPLQSPLQKTEMKWRLFSLLGQQLLLENPLLLPVRNYLQDDTAAELKRFQLAESIADLFDQYLIYRPKMIRQWQQQSAADLADANARWQCLLWQALQSPQGQHRAAIEQQLLDVLQKSDHLAARLPMQRLFVFGITSMHPSLLALLQALGRHIEVELYVLNPCRQYWGLIESARRLAGSEDGLYYEIGNPLLASQGVQLREFVELLQEVGDHHDAFIDHDQPQTLLHSIQQEILDLHYRGQSGAGLDYVVAGEKQPVPELDSNGSGIPSIHIHQCHSPQREVEVLHDQLRDMLANMPGLNPRDIVVMMPRVDNYVPYIHAVFNSVDESDRIAYQLADKSLLQESPFLQSFISLLDMANSRLALSEVLSVLEVAAVQQRFSIDHNDFETLREWLVQCGVRWGLNSQHRSKQGLPAYGEYSWQFAIDRMLAGFAMADSGEPLQLDDYAIAPYDQIEGGSATLLDSFLDFWQTLTRWRDRLQQPRSPSLWQQDLLTLLDDFYQPLDEADIRALNCLREAIAELGDAQSQHWCEQPLGIAVLRALLLPVLEQPAAGRHPWQEGVKFCSLLPMRAVPFRVVYVMGMNLDDYPRRRPVKSFDLMRNQHLPGDRASRIDDRWLFLEALLSARDVFNISYVGRDMHRNEQREPSVVLSELMDYIRHGYSLADNADINQWLITQHALQPFNAQYFYQQRHNLSERLISYNRHAFAIANANARRASNGVFTGTSRWQPEDLSQHQQITLDLNQWMRFFTAPWQWFLDNKYRLDLAVQHDGVSDEEDFSAGDGLAQWLMRRELIEVVNSQAQDDSEEHWQQLLDHYVQQRKASAAWPLGLAGEQCRQQLAADKDFYYRSFAVSQHNERLECRITFEHTTIIISGDLPVQQGDQRCVLLHTPSKQQKSRQRSLELLLRSSFAFAATQPVTAVRQIGPDGEISADVTDWTADQAVELNTMLAQYFIRWRNSGLPFDLAIADELLAAEKSDDKDALHDELLDEYWHKDNGAGTDLYKSLYFGSFASIRHDCFRQTCCQLAEVFAAAQIAIAGTDSKGEQA